MMQFKSFSEALMPTSHPISA